MTDLDIHEAPASRPTSTAAHGRAGAVGASGGAPSPATGPGLAGDTVDVRGPRFSAAVTATILATALVVQGSTGIALVTVQVAVFAIATVRGVTHSPWAHLFRFVARSTRLGPPTARESATPPRFAQACGLVVAGTGLVALLLGAPLVGWIAIGVVLALASLLAISGLCIGCELFVLGQRLLGGRQ